LIKNDAEKYARVDWSDNPSSPGIDSVNGFKGCVKFNPSGILAHPQILEVLVKRNSRCSLIPSDLDATQTSWDFDAKINDYLPPGNITLYDKIQ
jgi:hypothetical protein